MTERELAMCDLAFANGMQLASAMLAQGADERVRQCIGRLRSEALKVVRRPTTSDVATACARHSDGEQLPEKSDG